MFLYEEDPVEEENVTEEVEEVTAVASGADDEYASLREHYEADGQLDDAELDAVADLAVNFIKSILSYFGEEHVSIDEYDGDEGELILDVNGRDLAVLIGRHGRTLEALQTIVSSYMSNTLKFHYPVVVDIEGYKSRRKSKLQSLAQSAAARAKRQHGRASLPAMSAFERRIIHMTLLDDPEVSTHSEGEEPERHVVVTYVRS